MICRAFPALLALLGATASAAASKPNVVVILADDLGYADLSVHGSREVATPHIDALARDGVRCTSGYVSCPYCSPSRAGLLTGRYQQRFGHEFNPELLARGGKGQGLARPEVTVADRLKAAGYATGLLGKWHQGEEDKFHPLNRGFGEFFGFLPGAHPYYRSDDKTWGPIYRGRRGVELDGYLTDVLRPRRCPSSTAIARSRSSSTWPSTPFIRRWKFPRRCGGSSATSRIRRDALTWP